MLVARELKDGLSRNSVRLTHATLQAMLNSAVDDGVILANHANRLGRQFRLTSFAKHREGEVKAMDAEQLAGFLDSAEKESRHYGLFFLMSRAGLRLGEAFGLQWRDIDSERREIRVRRAVTRGHIGSTKSGRERTVDMSQQLVALLRRLKVARKAASMRRGEEVSPWVFATADGHPLEARSVEKPFKRVLDKAKLPTHFSPHCLRHTFASMMLQQGESPVYEQRQLGHASIQLSVDTYGRWLPMGNKAAVDRPDEAVCIKSVSLGGSAPPEPS